MFDNLKGMGALAGLMKDLPRIKARMDEVKERLASITVEAETGGGAVTATANGRMELVALDVDPALIRGLVDAGEPRDRALAQELIVGAVNAALTKAREAAEREMSQAAGDLGLPIPPGGLQGLLGNTP